MGMVGCFCALEDEDLQAIISVPRRIHLLWSDSIPKRRQPSWLARLFGAKLRPEPEEDPWQLSQPVVDADVDKAWHGIHFLLTGTEGGGEGPLAFMIHGGEDIKEEIGYGYPRGFTSQEVKEIAAALSVIDVDQLYEQANPADFARHGIYPEVWKDEPKEDCIGYVTDYLKELQKFVSDIATSNRAMIVYLA
ncbi:DUF1877 domain-containing protein [Blastopirellula marina]|uniref:DUF1877 domain-containing protein n=1 Tax=Blastopirellula marina TaxID=124 RepID=A0A2S8F5M9_9BACT|nr:MULTISPECIES: YfbM family protein [Pirellulaceae]PQO27469.1 DUF1877 domain-containing protein [Blastopirellula marina]RCS48006.1 DUF1877 family protein [Bremerella cremea]